MPDTRRYVTLDAMRGLAAAVVVCLHFGYQTKAWHPELGYLAVDAFFVISGFVLATRYDEDFAERRLGFASFMRKRVERLGPIYVLGFLLGLAAQYGVKPLPINPVRALAADGLNLVALPGFGILAPDSLMFPINAPFWSLFLKVWVANTIFSVFWHRLRGGGLLALLCVGAIGLVACAAVGMDMRCGFTEETALLGLARVTYSFFAGVIVARLHSRFKLSFSVPAPLILLSLACILSLPAHGWVAPVVDIAAMLFGFPALTFLGAQASHMHAKTGMLLGEVSYAAYALHIPLLKVVLALFKYRIHYHPAAWSGLFLATVFLLSFAAAKAETRLRSTIFSRRTAFRQPRLV